MIRPKEEPHTLNSPIESKFLHSLQKQILLTLAESYPRSRFDMSKAIKGDYHATCDAFDNLEENGIIAKTKVDEYRGRQHPHYWLTPKGVFIALIEGVSPTTLLRKVVELYPENKTLQCIVEVSTVLGTDMFRIAYPAVQKEKKLGEDEISLMFAAQLRKNLSWEQIRDLISIMRKYPEQFGNFNKQRDQMLENLKKVESILKNT
jgi:hypothetical protein